MEEPLYIPIEIEKTITDENMFLLYSKNTTQLEEPEKANITFFITKKLVSDTYTFIFPITQNDEDTQSVYTNIKILSDINIIKQFDLYVNNKLVESTFPCAVQEEYPFHIFKNELLRIDSSNIVKIRYISDHPYIEIQYDLAVPDASYLEKTTHVYRTLQTTIINPELKLVQPETDEMIIERNTLFKPNSIQISLLFKHQVTKVYAMVTQKASFVQLMIDGIYIRRLIQENSDIQFPPYYIYSYTFTSPVLLDYVTKISLLCITVAEKEENIKLKIMYECLRDTLEL